MAIFARKPARPSRRVTDERLAAMAHARRREAARGELRAITRLYGEADPNVMRCPKSGAS